MITKQMIVQRANEVRGQLDDTTAPIERLMNDHDVVVAVWQDPDEPDGVGTYVVKGRKLLAETHLSGQSRGVEWTAIPCIEYEQAVALEQMLGNKYN